MTSVLETGGMLKGKNNINFVCRVQSMSKSKYISSNRLLSLTVFLLPFLCFTFLFVCSFGVVYCVIFYSFLIFVYIDLFDFTLFGFLSVFFFPVSFSIM